VSIVDLQLVFQTSFSDKFIGMCLPGNKCLCWWGRTGPNAVYINAGSYKNRIVVSDDDDDDDDDC